MKNLITTTAVMLTTILFGCSTMAQPGYESAMGEALTSFGQAQQADDFIAAANRFEQIGATATKHWEPLYYAAYSQLVAGIMQENPSEKDMFFDKAFGLIESSKGRSADNSEVYALRGYIQYMQMSVDPQNRLDLMGAAEASIQRAIELDPQNPRPYFIKGQTTFYMPEFYGGGPKAAKPLLEKAMEKFDTFESSGVFAPNWGKQRAEMLLHQTTAK